MTTTANIAAETFEAAWNRWHQDRERYFGDPLGWVSLTGFIGSPMNSTKVADLRGVWRADTDAVYVEGIDGTDRLEPVRGCTRSARRRRGSPYRGHSSNRLGRVAGARPEVSAPADVTRAFPPTHRANSGASQAHSLDTSAEDRYDGGRRRRTRTPPQRRWRCRLRTRGCGPTARRVRRGRRPAASAVHRCHQWRDDRTPGSGHSRSPSQTARTANGHRGHSISTRASNLPCSFTDYATCPGSSGREQAVRCH